MKLVIAGGRDYVGTLEDLWKIKEAIMKYNITEIVSGKQKGGDRFGEDCAALLDIPVQPFPPNWDDLTVQNAVIKGRRDGSLYNVNAGPDRNRKMAEYTDYVFLLPGGKGTASMRKEALVAGKKIIYDNGWPKKYKYDDVEDYIDDTEPK